MFEEFGRTTISEIEDLDKVSDYCQKHVLDYTTKGDVRGLGVYDYKFGNGTDGKRFYTLKRSVKKSMDFFPNGKDW